MTAAPTDVVRDWFAAHGSGDMAKASALLAPHATISVDGTTMCGLDEFLAWYGDRAAAEGPGFGYELVDLLAGDHHAATVLRLHRADGTSWRQVALYQVESGRITEITAYEDVHAPPKT